MGAMQRRKGKRLELEIVNAHKAIGIHAERVPHSGAAHYKGEAHDVDVYAAGRDAAPFCCEVKGRKDGFLSLTRWLADNDALFLKRNRSSPLVVMEFSTWAALVRRSLAANGSLHATRAGLRATSATLPIASDSP